MAGRATGRHRAKISVAADLQSLKAVDAFVAEHGEFDRSKVIDEALRLWYARERERAKSPASRSVARSTVSAPA